MSKRKDLPVEGEWKEVGRTGVGRAGGGLRRKERFPSSKERSRMGESNTVGTVERGREKEKKHRLHAAFIHRSVNRLIVLLKG